jgi:adenylate cyclase
VLRGLVSYHQVIAQLDRAHEVGELLLRHAADNPDDPVLRVQAHYGQGTTLFHMGRLEDARTHLEAALRDYDPGSHREHVTAYGGYDPGVACTLWLAWTLAIGGRLDEAAAHAREGLALARRHADAFTLAFACHAAGIAHQLFGEWETAERLAAESLALSEEHGFPYVRGMALTNQGSSLVVLGKAPHGIRLLREGVAAVDATGSRLVRSSYEALLGVADALEGNVQSALRRFDEAVAQMERTGERFYEAGVLVAKSNVLAVAPRSKAEAGMPEACLRRALEVARSQGAHLLELRAAVGLARHCREQGRDPEGRALLEAAYGRFADTRIASPEVVAARELLGAAAR